MQMTQNVLDSPAVAVLCDLELAGLDLTVVDGRLRVWPVERLTAEHERLIQDPIRQRRIGSTRYSGQRWRRSGVLL